MNWIVEPNVMLKICINRFDGFMRILFGKLRTVSTVILTHLFKSPKHRWQQLADDLFKVASNLRKTEQDIADTKLELIQLKDAKAHSDTVAANIRTGWGSAFTHADGLRAQATASIQERSARSASMRLEEETSRARIESEKTEQMLKRFEDKSQDFVNKIDDFLTQEDSENSTDGHDR